MTPYGLKDQLERRIQPEADALRYHHLQVRLSAMLAEYPCRGMDLEFMELWRELEAIKERNGGMPPKEV